MVFVTIPGASFCDGVSEGEVRCYVGRKRPVQQGRREPVVAEINRVSKGQPCIVDRKGIFTFRDVAKDPALNYIALF